jgi:hypothetical protein
MTTKTYYIVCDIKSIPQDSVNITDFCLKGKERVILKISSRILSQVKRYDKHGFDGCSNEQWGTRLAVDVLNENIQRWWPIKTILKVYRYGEII